MKKTLFFLFIFISANAQNKRTINLEIAGTLFSKINTEINNVFITIEQPKLIRNIRV